MLVLSLRVPPSFQGLLTTLATADSTQQMWRWHIVEATPLPASSSVLYVVRKRRV